MQPSAWLPAQLPFPMVLARWPVRICSPNTFEPSLRTHGPTTSPFTPAGLPTHQVTRFQVCRGEALKDVPGPTDKFQAVFVPSRSFLSKVGLNPKKEAFSQR